MKKATILCLGGLFVVGNVVTSCKSAKTAPQVQAEAPAVETPAQPTVVETPKPTPQPIDVAGINAKVNELLNKNAVTFQIDKDELSSESKANIDAAIPYVNQFPSVMITINGHCDESGSAELNDALSKKRAESVKKYLVSKGLNADRFQTVGLGFSNPIAPNTTPENRAKNRRAVFSVSLTEAVILEAKSKGLL